MTLIKIAAAIAVMLIATVSNADAAKRHKGHKAAPPIILNIDSIQVYAYDANGNTSPFRNVETLSAKRHQHSGRHYAHHRGGSCDGIHKCRCGSTQAAHFGLPRNYHGYNLWLAADWPRAFPRTSAHPGAVGWVPGHVFRYVGEGSRLGYAMVSDDAGTYERRISGAIFVDPSGNNAMASEQPRYRGKHATEQVFANYGQKFGAAGL